MNLLVEGDDITVEKRRRLLNEARILYTKHPGLEYKDPFYNVNLTKYKSDYSLDVEEKTVYSAYLTIFIRSITMLLKET